MTVSVFVFSLLGAMAIGMPIAYALLVCGLALMGFMAATGALPAFDSQILAQRFVDGADNFPLLAVPFFLLAGEFMNAGGLSRRIVNLAMAWVGHFRGGLGYVAVLAAVIMASLSGSAVADTAALAALLIPMMKQAGYDVNRSRRPDRRRRHHRAGDPAVDRHDHLRRGRQRLDHQAVPGRHRSRRPDGRGHRRDLVVDRQARRHPAGAAHADGRAPEGHGREAAWALALPVVILGGMKFGVFTPDRGGRGGRRLQLRGGHVRLPRAQAAASCTA